MIGMTEREPERTQQRNRYTPVCAIGASAGGVGALQGLFRMLPVDLGFAYVIILHLAPDHPSSLHEILGSCTSMSVQQVTGSPALKPNCVYVIPPGRELVIDGEAITARPFSTPRGKRAPIDMFFRSIAAARGDGIAVVLSGAGSDGALGIRAIKEAGGIIFVQEPSEASFPSMPQNAIASGEADFVAPLARLVDRIVEVAHSKEAVRSLDLDGDANELRRIITLLYARTGHDLSRYKRATLMRRVARRLQVCRLDGLSEYAEYLRKTPEEAQELLSDLLISVTQFFRDASAFQVLALEAVQPIFDDVEEEGVRAWVVGCATGEEAYSIAILLLEEAARRKIRTSIQIFATDIDERALAIAREGRYPRTIEADVSPARLERFFIEDGEHYRIRKEVRDTVLFTAHSVLKDPPFMRLDLVSCRNLLIYLERALQQQVCALFHYGLKPNRFLFLGSAETADATPDLFSPVDRDARLYRPRPQAVPPLVALPQFPLEHSRSFVGKSKRAVGSGRDVPAAEAHAEALERSAPPSVLVDESHNIVHLSPTAGRFILHSAGPFTSRLPAVVRPELRLDLRLALDRAFEQNLPTLTHATPTSFGEELRRIAMQIIPVSGKPHTIKQAVVFFVDGGPAEKPDQADAAAEVKPDELHRLHAELKAAQEALVSSRQDHEISIQELRAANEELQSINEEYRSTSEELETSKEELQSINEELQTVNAELKSKLQAISAAHDDLQNLTAATEIGTLFLDHELRIKMFTPPMADLFNIADSDEGRLITHFTNRLRYDAIERDVKKVLRDLVPMETEVETTDGRWLMMRLRPYRTMENRIEGAVVTFVDITARLEAQHKLAESQKRLLALVRASSQVLYRMSPEWSEMRELSGGGLLADTERPNRDWLQHYIHPEDQPRVKAAIEEAIRTKTVFELEHRVRRADGSLAWTLSRAVPILDDKGKIIEWFGAASDITERRSAAEQNATLLAELQHRVRNVLALVISIVSRSGGSSASVNEYRERLTGRLASLARTQALLTRAAGAGIDLAELLRGEISSGEVNGKQVEYVGPTVELGPKSAEVLNLMIHELTTNSIKYGALSSRTGKLVVKWKINEKEGDRWLHLAWKESGMTVAAWPEHKGFGTELITRRIPYELRGTASLEFEPDGILCTINFPLQRGPSILQTDVHPSMVDEERASRI
jgi:two-component system, chemotaxis family, CheB/CheR fusion protein